MSHTMDVKIYYEDTDCGNVVYYANYLKYMERGRTEYLAERGISIKQLMDQGTLFVVARAEIDYRSSARYGETIVLRTWIAESTRVSLLFGHTMTDKASGRLIAEAQTRLVCVDSHGKIKRLPPEMTERLT